MLDTSKLDECGRARVTQPDSAIAAERESMACQSFSPCGGAMRPAFCSLARTRGWRQERLFKDRRVTIMWVAVPGGGPPTLCAPHFRATCKSTSQASIESSPISRVTGGGIVGEVSIRPRQRTVPPSAGVPRRADRIRSTAPPTRRSMPPSSAISAMPNPEKAYLLSASGCDGQDARAPS